MFNRIKLHIENNDEFAPEQYGYLNDTSTQTAVLN
jgi:hypothetical protein